MKEHRWCENHVTLFDKEARKEAISKINCGCCDCYKVGSCTSIIKAEPIAVTHIHRFDVAVMTENGFWTNNGLIFRSHHTDYGNPVATRVTLLACSNGDCDEVRKVKHE